MEQLGLVLFPFPQQLRPFHDGSQLAKALAHNRVEPAGGQAQAVEGGVSDRDPSALM